MRAAAPQTLSLFAASLALVIVSTLPSCYPSKPPAGDSGQDTGPSVGPHPAGWAAAGEHGLAAKLQDLECASCHGLDLLGGSAGRDCDSCHPSGWRTDCTWCHGGVDNSTGAPPLDMDDASTGLSFPEHTAHVGGPRHPAYGCVECHVMPADVLTSGHLFVEDDSAAVAELTFSGGLAATGSYAGSGSCSNIYCHGDGRGAGGTATSGDSYDCGDCHGDAGSARDLSGEHREHIHEGVVCVDCHRDTVSSDTQIATPDNHVNGHVEVAFGESGMSWNGSSCDGQCHGERHSNERW